jgi:hypothetical protein
MIYDETNSIAYSILNQIGEWIKGEDETHVFQIDLKDVNKTFSVTIDCEQNNVTCVQEHGEFAKYDENNISSNLLSYKNNHFDQDEKNEEIYWINFGTHTIRVELELEFIQLSVYETNKEYVNPIYSKSFEWKEEQ